MNECAKITTSHLPARQTIVYLSGGGEAHR